MLHQASRCVLGLQVIPFRLSRISEYGTIPEAFRTQVAMVHISMEH